MNTKKIPLRHCVGCGAELPKSELCRVIRTPEGRVTLDLTGRANGRGAYICKKVQCLKKARKTGRIANSLGVAISDEIYDEIEKTIEE